MNPEHLTRTKFNTARFIISEVFRWNSLTTIYVLRSWKSRAVPLLTLWASVACYRENLYLYLTHAVTCYIAISFSPEKAEVRLEYESTLALTLKMMRLCLCVCVCVCVCLSVSVCLVCVCVYPRWEAAGD
jgi:hypothetical protein